MSKRLVIDNDFRTTADLQRRLRAVEMQLAGNPQTTGSGGSSGGSTGGTTTSTAPSRRVLLERHGSVPTSAAANAAYTFSGDGVTLNTAANAARSFFYLDPSDYAVSGYSVRLGLRLAVISGATSPNATYRAAMYAAGTPAGAASAEPTGPISTQVSNSLTPSVAITTAGAKLTSTITDFAAPAAGFYAIGVFSTTSSPSSVVSVGVTLTLAHLAT
jgi:hypothetical protein